MSPRVAVLNDIHGNLPALEAVLAEVDASGCDLIVVGGDAALGPMPRETLDVLLARGERVRFVRGNCDRDMVQALEREPNPNSPWAARLRWAAREITPAQRAVFASLPLTLTLEIDGLGAVLFCHGSPRDDDEIVTRVSPVDRVSLMLAGVEPRTVVSGHTHSQFDREVLGHRWINAGSVGMPYEDRPGAYWLLLGPGVAFQRTDYDLEEAARRIASSGFPDAGRFVERELLAAQGPDEASEFFERIAGERARAGSG